MIDVLQGDPEIVLRTSVRLVEEIDEPNAWFGRLAMDLEFLDFKTGKSLMKYTFDRRLPLGARKVQFLPAVLSGILVEELDVAVRKLAGGVGREIAQEGTAALSGRVRPLSASGARSPRASGPSSPANRPA